MPVWQGQYGCCGQVGVAAHQGASGGGAGVFAASAGLGHVQPQGVASGNAAARRTAVGEQALVAWTGERPTQSPAQQPPTAVVAETNRAEARAPAPAPQS